MKQILTTVIFLCFYSVYLHAQSWQIDTMAAMPEPVSNNGVSQGYMNGVAQVYSFAGIDSTRTHAGIHLRSYRYNTQTDTWHSIAPLPDTLGKIAAIASTVKNKIYIIGGFHEVSATTEIITNRVHIYDCETDAFLADGTNLPTPTGDQVQGVWNDSLIYVISGWGGVNNLTNVQIYNPSTDTWQAGTPLPSSNSYRSFGSSGMIIGNTIYFFGGGSSSFPFGVQPYFRKGIIDPNDPTQITWSIETWSGYSGYRMAATEVLGKACWIGGAKKTYLFDALAYNGSGVVQPAGEIIQYNPISDTRSKETGYALPMDLRGIGNLSDTVKYLAGGMLANRAVSRQMLRLRAIPDSIITSINPIAAQKPLQFSIAPNPATISTTINLQKSMDVTYSVYTLTGVWVEQKRLSQVKTFEIDTKNYTAGVYFISINTPEGEEVQQLIVH